MRRINYYYTFVWMYRSKFFYPFLLVLLWAIMECIIKPYGNFPLNDDWQYARPVWYLINKGYYFSSDIYSPIIIAQVFWGALFCIPGGFSFNTLRISTLVLSLAGILVFYFLLLKSSKNQKISFLGALLLAANPLYTILSNGFMTDIPFLTFAILSIYFFICSIESNKRVHIIIATLFAIVATLIRQFGIAIPIAYSIVVILKNKSKPIQYLLYSLPAIITIIALNLGLWWLKHIGSELMPYQGGHLTDYLSKPGDIFESMLKRGSYLLAYSGFFLLPLFTYNSLQALFKMTKPQKIIMFSSSIIILPILVEWCRKLPVRNVLSTYGNGPLTLKGMHEIVSAPNPNFSPMLLKIIHIVALAGAMLLFINLVKVLMDIVTGFIKRTFTQDLLKQAFILSLFGIYAFFLFVPDFTFDRYLLPFIPLSAIILLSEIKKEQKIRLPVYIGYCIVVIAMGLFSSALTHDYFEWNRSRWQATDYLTKDLKISPHKIDGGYEFNGWTIGTYYPDDPKNPNKSWWFVDDDEYVVAFHNFDGYTIIKNYPYQNYVPYEIKNIYILHRK